MNERCRCLLIFVIVPLVKKQRSINSQKERWMNLIVRLKEQQRNSHMA
jgi:hypothetical protein